MYFLFLNWLPIMKFHDSICIFIASCSCYLNGIICVALFWTEGGSPGPHSDTKIDTSNAAQVLSRSLQVSHTISLPLNEIVKARSGSDSMSDPFHQLVRVPFLGLSCYAEGNTNTL